jgi:site-specific recombinase XerD
MTNKRKDNKGRVLRNGEYQQTNGRYRYKYYDGTGRAKYLYSWRLDKNDRYPEGRAKGRSLRELEADLQADLFEGVSSDGGSLTVLELLKRYVATKIGVRESTRNGYFTTIRYMEKDPFGQRRIDTVKTSDAKLWLITLQQKYGKGYSTIHTMRGILRPAFRMAYDDDLIRRNPFDFELSTVVVNDSVTREAITAGEERKYLEFVKQDKHFGKYYEGIFILFNTGLRISEFVGLTTKNIDFKHHKIIVDHQLIRTSQMKYMIEKTKTESGVREVPMSAEVEEAFRRIMAKRMKPKAEPVIDGHSGFLYLDKNGMPMVALHWEKYFQRILEKYNSIYKLQMPKVTPHVCRHTFCSKMAKSGMNPKSLQYIMGHSDIGVTLNTYTHVKFEDAEAEMKRVATL